VDVPGDALQSVIITKLPFDVPKEPLTEARIEELGKQNIDPFRHYQIPRAIIQLKQGFGRLIRKKTDTGVVSILDSRMSRRGYGIACGTRNSINTNKLVLIPITKFYTGEPPVATGNKATP